jgi:hypothetical protein
MSFVPRSADSRSVLAQRRPAPFFAQFWNILLTAVSGREGFGQVADLLAWVPWICVPIR